MDFWLPKYKELYIRDGSIKHGNSIRGEYRAILRGLDGRVKQDSGWKPNMVTNYGLQYIARNFFSLNYMALGTSNVAEDVTQTGLQGSFLGYDTPTSGGVGSTGAPDYGKYTLDTFVFGTGNGTGTIKEFILTEGFDPDDYNNKGAVRVVLDTPIVKGAQDQLTMQHKLYIYQDLVDATGTVDISGVDYDYVIRPYGVSFTTGMQLHRENIATMYGGESATRAGKINNEPLIGIQDTNVDDPTDKSSSSETFTNGGTLPNFYREITYEWDVDSGNMTFSNVYSQNYYYFDGAHKRAGVQYSLFATIGGAAFIKENTHVLNLTHRIYSTRYVP